jgi:hypothetical protein
MVSQIASITMKAWKSLNERSEDPYDSGDYRVTGWYGAREWAKGKTRIALCNRIKKRQRQVLEEAYGSEFMEVLYKVYAHTHRNLIPHSVQVLYGNKDKYLWKDIIQHRAAAHAIADWDYESMGQPAHDTWTRFYAYQYNYNSSPQLSRSKRRTIMNMPGNISSMTIKFLRRIQLDAPIFKRSELIWACIAASRGDAYGGGRIRDRTGAGQPIWAHVGVSRYIESGGNILQLPDGTVTVSFKFAKEDDIKRAMALLTRIQGREYRPHSIRNTKSYIALAVYIYDALSVSDVVDGATTVTSALKRAHAWHRDNAQVLAQRHMTPIEPGLTDKKTLTAVPPIELPSNKNIRFLATVQDVVDEGKEMGHCVGGYWDRAVKGKEYLFHIEYKGEQATASVSSASGYVQCLGPNNYVNSASIYGEKLLKSWARSLPNIGVNVTHKIADFIALPLAAEEIPF